MKYFYFYPKVVLSLLILFAVSNTIAQQTRTIRINGNSSTFSTNCGDTFSGQDPWWGIDASHPCAETGTGRFGNCDGCASSRDVQIYDNRNITLERNLCEDDVGNGDCGAGDECRSTNTSTYITITGAGVPTISAGTVQLSGGGYSNINQTASVALQGTSGNGFSPNNQMGNGGVPAGQFNRSCANAWTLTANSTGTVIAASNAAAHSFDCADDVWYKYQLTTAGLKYLSFYASSYNDGIGTCLVFTNTSYVEEVRYSATDASCGGTCTLSDAGATSNDFDVQNPQPGFYWIRVHGSAYTCRSRLFSLSISHTTNSLAYDNICNALNVQSGTLSICGSLTQTANNIGASIEDFCTIVDEPEYSSGDQTVWLKFTAPATIGTNCKIYVNGSSADDIIPRLNVYKLGAGTLCPAGSATNFSVIGSKIATDGGVAALCLGDKDAEVNLTSCSGAYEAGKTYYLQIDNIDGTGCGDGIFTVTVTDNGKIEGQNYICSAADMTAAPPATSGSCSYGSNADGDGILEVSETISRLNQSNYCANTQVGEPELGSVVCIDQIASTVWYKFTTGTTAAPITVRVWDDGDAGGSDDIDPYFSVYKSCVGCTFGTNLVQVGEAGGTDVLGGAEADDYSITFNPAPSSTYYIQVGGWVDGALCGNSEKGDFNVSAAMAATALKGDYICDAHIAGSTGWSETGGTNDDLLELGETMQTTSVFTNKGAYSVEDGCGLDEPDNSDGDETVWFKFKTSGTVGTEIAVNVDAVSGSGEGAACPGGVGTTLAWMKVWEWTGTGTGPACSDATRFDPLKLVDIGRPDLVDQSKEYIDCPKPNTWYFAQCELGFGSTCDRANFNATITDNGIPQAPNDRICNATVLSTPTYTNPQSLVGTYTKHYLQNQNNFCAGAVEDPAACWSNPENDKTVWYKLPAAAAPGASDISNPGRKVVIINAYSEHAAGDEDEINLQLALYTNSNMASCPTNPTTGYTLTSDIQGDNCAYIGPASLDIDQLFQYSEYLTAACLTPATDYYLQVDGNDLDLVLDEVLREGWFEFEAYYPREIGDLPCSAVPFKLFGKSNGFTNGYDNATGASGTGDATKTGLTDNLYNNSNLCTNHTPGTGANQEPGTTFTTGNGNDNPGWVYFYAPPSGSVRITATADPQDIMKDGIFDNIDLQLAIYQETTPGNCSIIQPPQSPVSSIVSYNILDGYGEVMYVNCLTPGRKYYLEIDGSASPITQTRGIFDLKIEDYQPNAYASNDLMCDAIPFSDSYIATNTWNRINYKDTLYIGDTKNWCADNLGEPGRPALGGYNETGVWYKFIAPPSGKIHILAENTDYGSLSKPSGDPNHIDLSLAIYKLNQDQGYSCTDYNITAATTLIAQDYENPLVTSGVAIAGTSAEDEEMEVSCLIPGQEYYLLVSGKKSAGIGSDWDYGRFNLTITSDPRNPASWNGVYNTVSGNQYLPAALNPSIDTVCGAANLGTMPAGTTWFQPFSDRKVPNNCSSNYYMSPPFNNFCATATSDPTPGYQQSTVNAFGSNHQPVWFKFTTPSMGAYDPSIISVEIEAISGDCSTAILDDWYDNGCTPSDEVYQDCIDLGVSLWMASNGTCSGPLYEMGSDYDLGSYDEDATIHCLDPNTTYYIMVDGSALNEEGNFNLRIQQVNPDPRPSNNFICNAKKLTTGAASSPASFWGGGAAFTYEKDTNICADTRLNTSSAAGTEPIPSGWDVVSPPSDAADMTHTVWYSFVTPTAAGDYAVHIDVNSDLPWPFGDLVNPKIAVWESQDGTCNYSHPNGTNMVEMASEYDPLAFWGESIDVYCLKPNTRYYVQVGGTLNVYGQEQGFFDIVIDDIPPITIPANDNVCNAFNVGTTTNAGSVTISSVPGNKIGNASSGANNYHNYCTDLEAGEPQPDAFDADNTVWFKFKTPNVAGKRYDVTVNANSDPAPDHNDGINLQLALYESSDGTCDFTKFTELGSDFDGLLWDETLSVTCLKPNMTYYVQVDGTKGFLELFRAQGFGYFGLEVVTDAVYNAPSNDDVCSATNLGTVPIGGNINNGTWYYNNCATTQTSEPIDIPTDISSYDVDKSVWFRFTAGRDADYTIQLESDALLGTDPIDLQVAVFRATNGCSDFTSFVQEAADYDPGFFDEDLTLPCVKSGQEYYIQVDGSGVNMEGRFKIRIYDDGAATSGPANDNICSLTTAGAAFATIALTGATQGVTNQNNICATTEASEPNAPADVQKSVWYRFQASASGRLRLTLHDADGAFRGLDPEMYLYEVGPTWNCNFGSWTTPGVEMASAYNPIPDIPIVCPNCGDEEIEYECFVPGWWYVVQVDGTTVGGAQGKFDLTIEDLLYPYTIPSGNQPANNDIANAVTVSVQDEQCVVTDGEKIQGSGTWQTYNYGKPTRDLNNGLGGGGCSITDLCGDTWYKFTVPAITCAPGSPAGSMPVYTPIMIQGSARYDANFIDDESKLHVIAYKGSPGSLTAIGCGTAGKPNLTTGDQFFNFEISEAQGTVIYLQVFGEQALDWDKDFDLCVSERKGFDECIHAAQAPPMQYGEEYCYNIKGATSEPSSNGYDESCPLTGIAVPDPDSDAPTENSTYFKFTTDNSCADYRLTFKYYFTSYSALNNKGISYSIYKDNTPCDGSPIGSGTLDCQSFYNTSVSSNTYVITYQNNMYLTVASGIDTSATYYIQIDGPGQTFGNLDGTIKIEQVPVCLPIVIDSMPVISMTQYYTCGDGWRHYYHTVGSQRKYKFSLFDNGNTSLQGIAKIYYATDHYTESIGCEYASHVMRRYWDYEITSGSIDPAKPVSIRFYYLPVEKQEIIDAMMSFQASGCPGTAEGFEWFKSCNGIAFDYAAHTNPYYVYACYGSGISTGAAFSLTTVDDVSCNNVTYVEYQGLTGFSGGTGATGNGYAPTPLPIELISFTGSYNEVNHTNDLQWATASEFNNDYFVVEKSLDGSIFVPIGTVDGAGNSNTVLNYTLIDPNPVIGNNYYRLVQYDFDGTSTTSPIINIKVADPIPYQATYIDRIYPNPTSGKLNVDIMVSVEQLSLNMSVTNVIGQHMRDEVLNLQKGKNTIVLDASAYAQGVYLINLMNKLKDINLNSKFVKQ